MKDIKMAVYANYEFESLKCKTTGFYDSNYILIKRRDSLNKNPLVNLGMIRNIEICHRSL